MPTPLDLEQLKTFLAIYETGSFTRAADNVHKTQSAVSMQIRRLEEKLGKPLFTRDGRQSKLTEEGETLVSYARRMLRLSDEALALFNEEEVTGSVSIGIPDDYADRFLPDILARFFKFNPKIKVEVICENTENLIEYWEEGRLDLAIISNDPEKGNSNVIREEPLLWVTSKNHDIHLSETLPLACGRQTCVWLRDAIEALNEQGRPYNILYSSWSANVITAAVQSGLAVSILPESALRSGMRVLTNSDGFPTLPNCKIALLQPQNKPSEAVAALTAYVIESLQNMQSNHSPIRAASSQGW